MNKREESHTVLFDWDMLISLWDNIKKPSYWAHWPLRDENKNWFSACQHPQAIQLQHLCLLDNFEPNQLAWKKKCIKNWQYVCDKYLTKVLPQNIRGPSFFHETTIIVLLNERIAMEIWLNTCLCLLRLIHRYTVALLPMLVRPSIAGFRASIFQSTTGENLKISSNMTMSD